jgi:hypothetical protein
MPRSYLEENGRLSSNRKGQTSPLLREDISQGLLPQVFSWKIKLLVVGLKGLVAKTN